MKVLVQYLAVMDLIVCCLGIDYLVDPTGGQSCVKVCSKEHKICAGTGHGFSPVSAQSILQSMGITCGRDDGKGSYKTPDNPSYKVLEFENYDQCMGYKGIPENINCTARGYEDVKRICPCVQGTFLRFQFIETLLGSTTVVSFVIDGQQYLAFNRLRVFREFQSGTQIYRLEGNTFTFYQTLKTTYNAPGRASYFQIGPYHYIAIPYFARSRSGKRAPKTVIFTLFEGYFDTLQELNGGMALSTTFIKIKSLKLLVIQGYQALTIFTWRRSRFAKLQSIPIEKRAYVTDCSLFKPGSGDFYMTCAVWGGRKRSLVLKWSGKRFLIHQRIPRIEYAMSAETTRLDTGKFALLIAQRQIGYRARMNITTHLLTWDNGLSRFVFNKSLKIKTRGASASRPFRINNELFIAVSQSADRKSVIYKYKNGKFVVYQELRAAFADDLTFFTHSRIHYLVLATQSMRFSPAFIWN